MPADMKLAARWIILAALVCSAASCTNKLSGSVDAKTKEAGSFSMTPTKCFSGEREGFFGVQLEDGSDNFLRAVKDPTKGYVVLVKVPDSDKTLSVTKTDCTKFDIRVETQSSTINDIRNVTGHIRVDCSEGDDTLKAKVTFENCH